MKIEKFSAPEYGFATLDSLVGIVLVCVGALGIAAFMNVAGQAQLGISSASEFYNLKTAIRTILSSPETCTPNFLSVDPNLYTSPQAVVLQRFEINASGVQAPMTGPDSTIGTVTSEYGSLKILSGQVLKKQKIASNLYMMAYQVSVARSSNASGASVLSTEVPFSMLTDGADHVSLCFTDPFTGGSALLESFVCMFASGDQQYYDPGSKKCVSKYDFPTQTGDAFSAGPCTIGSLGGCYVQNGNGTGAGASVSQVYPGYPTPQVTQVPGAYGFPDPANPGKCACNYSTGYSPPAPSGGELCTIKCKVLKSSLVNIWPYQPAGP